MRRTRAGRKIRRGIGKAAIIHDVAEALAAARAAGVDQRDIKSGCIIIDEHGRARILDFGISRAVASAPDFDSDIYSLGVVVSLLAYLLEAAPGGLADVGRQLRAL